MNASLSFEHPIRMITLDGEDRRLDAGLIARLVFVDLETEIRSFEVPGIHAQQDLGPILSVDSSGSGMHAHDGGPVVVFAEEQRLTLEASQRLLDGGDLHHNLGNRGLIVFFRCELEQDLGVAERPIQGSDLLDRLFVTSEPAGDREGVVLVFPEVGGGRALSQLDELLFLAGDVKGTSGRRRGANGGP
jgi:hypothetical protein